jgi:hypothetical protein
MTRFLIQSKAKLSFGKNPSKNCKNHIEKKEASIDSWEMSARDALRVNFLTSEVR